MSVEGPERLDQDPNLYNQIIAKTREQHRLFSVHWELTYRCTERCSHCYLDVRPASASLPDELNTAECCRVLDELAALGTLHLTFSGGEALARREFFTIAEYAHAKRFLLRLFTNGILITPRAAERIAALHPYAVELSIYSTHAETHDRITRLPRSFELTTRAFRLLRERGVRTVMKTPLMRENVREYHALKTFAAELGAQFRYDITITAQDNGGLAPLQHRMTYDDLVWLFREAIDPNLWVARTVKPAARTCAIAQSAILIDPYGNVFPCVQTRIAAGNVREQSLRALWEESPVWQELGNLTLDTLPVCRTCELQTLCVRCHGLAYVEEGDLRAPALVNCYEALARRQVIVEKGLLPADFPISARLREQISSLVPEFLSV